MADTIYQDSRTGKRVRRIGAAATKENFVMVKGESGAPYYVALNRLLPVDDKGTPDFDYTPPAREVPEEAMPEPVIDIVETRLNINTATAEQIAKKIPGISYTVAKAMVALRMTLPGEVFRTLDQVRGASPRVAWDKVLRDNLLYLG
jgi:DNA uptake protein ComE-like DNA-binding protein